MSVYPSEGFTMDGYPCDELWRAKEPLNINGVPIKPGDTFYPNTGMRMDHLLKIVAVAYVGKPKKTKEQ